MNTRKKPTPAARCRVGRRILEERIVDVHDALRRTEGRILRHMEGAARMSERRLGKYMEAETRLRLEIQFLRRVTTSLTP